MLNLLSLKIFLIYFQMSKSTPLLVEKVKLKC